VDAQQLPIFSDMLCQSGRIPGVCGIIIQWVQQPREGVISGLKVSADTFLPTRVAVPSVMVTDHRSLKWYLEDGLLPQPDISATYA
jgi:hypothetical protein